MGAMRDLRDDPAAIPELRGVDAGVPGAPLPADRGRQARSPASIPPRGWLDVTFRVFDQLGADRVLLIGAGIAFYGFLALVPAFVAVVSVYGLISSPADVTDLIDSYLGAAPKELQDFVETQLELVASRTSSTLGTTLALSVLGAVWTSSGGVAALLQGINVAYDEDDERNFAIRRLWAAAGTLVAGVFVVATVFLIAVGPRLLDEVGLGTTARAVLGWGRWPLLALLFVAALTVLYRTTPDRRPARWRWITPGAFIATLVWLGGSALFALFAANFANYDETYGSVAGFVVLLLWLWITNVSILLGAEINSELERQTVVDSTIDPVAPLGRRGAYAADTLGDVRH